MFGNPDRYLADKRVFGSLHCKYLVARLGSSAYKATIIQFTYTLLHVVQVDDLDKLKLRTLPK